MSALHEAARLVVAAWSSTRRTWVEECNAAVMALDAALKAQPEPAQEPYCHAYEYDSVFGLHREFYPRVYSGRNPDRAVPLYTAPPQRPLLTDEEITDAVREADLDWQAGWTLDEHEPNRFTTLARAVERKVRGEK